MVEVRPNPSQRLNLLLTDGGWRDESWADRLPRLLEPMGVRTVRARTGLEAQRVIQAQPVHIAVVDLSLPLDETPAPASPPREGGPRLLELLARQDVRPTVVVVKRPRPARDEARELAAALQHGAFAAVDPPVNLETILQVMQRIIMKRFADRWPDPPSPT